MSETFDEALLNTIAQAPFAASDFAVSVDRLFYVMLAVCSFVTLAIAVLITVFCIRYRPGKARNRHIEMRHPRLPEYLWISIPLVIFIGFFVWGAMVYLQLHRLPENAVIIHGVGKQWMWKFYHSGGQREINELHVPVNRPVIVRLASEDVIHSFFIPNFRVKQDVVPGRYTRTWFRATEPGVYRLFCAEYCGTEHSRMRGTMTVMTAENYADWLSQQPHNETLAVAGEKLFRHLGCSGCHAPASSRHAPSLQGVYGRVVHLNDGGTVKADLAYLRDSILLPEKHVVAGYAPIMPSFANQISEEELLKLLNYIQMIGGEDTPRRLYNAGGQ